MIAFIHLRASQKWTFFDDRVKYFELQCLLGETLKIKRLLEGLSEEKAPGPYPSFSILHLIKALELMSERGQVGRGRLSKELEVGEGVARTLIGRLRDAEVIVVSRLGCSLTEEGKKVWNRLQSIFPQKVRLEKNELTLAAYDVAVLVRGCGHKVRSGIGQRDAAIVAGAKGANTLVYRNQKLTLPAISEDVAVDFPIVFRRLNGLPKLEENDVVVVGSADTLRMAEYGAMAAAWTLVDDCG